MGFASRTARSDIQHRTDIEVAWNGCCLSFDFSSTCACAVCECACVWCAAFAKAIDGVCTQL